MQLNAKSGTLNSIFKKLILAKRTRASKTTDIEYFLFYVCIAFPVLPLWIQTQPDSQKIIHNANKVLNTIVWIFQISILLQQKGKSDFAM